MSKKDDIDLALSSVDEGMVRACYRAFLEREPESDLVIEAHVQAKPALEDFLNSFLQSSEFARRKIEPKHSKAREKLEIDLSGTPDEMQKLLKHMKNVWSGYGKNDPYYSVLTNEKFKNISINNKEIKEFYETSINDYNFIISTLERNYIELKKEDIVLDFGCGLGRVGSAFAKKNQPYIGVDISLPHLKQAETYFTEMDFENCQFLLLEEFFGQNEVANFIFSLIVLQHNPPPVIGLLVEQMCRALRPGGTLLFQVPTRLDGYRFKMNDYVSHLPSHGVMEMHAFPQQEIFKLLREHKCTPVEVFEADMIGPIGESTIFVAVKDSKPPQV